MTATAAQSGGRAGGRRKDECSTTPAGAAALSAERRDRRRPQCDAGSGGSDPHAHTEIRVHFHPDSVPAEVCHCVWPALDESPLTEAVVELDDTRSAAEVFNILQPGSLVGFRWSWPEAT